MSQPAKAHEPSMEEILASIRRIIADDDGKAPPAEPAPQPRPTTAAPPPPPIMAPTASNPPPAAESPAPASEPSGILELTESMAAPADDQGRSFQTIDGQSDVVFADPPPPPEPPRAPAAPRPTYGPPPDRSLLSATASASIDSAFNALAQTVLVQNARTLEDLVREMLRPMLKSWLDDNLPSLVERIVKAEIERVSRGRT